MTEVADLGETYEAALARVHHLEDQASSAQTLLQAQLTQGHTRMEALRQAQHAVLEHLGALEHLLQGAQEHLAGPHVEAVASLEQVETTAEAQGTRLTESGQHLEHTASALRDAAQSGQQALQAGLEDLRQSFAQGGTTIVDLQARAAAVQERLHQGHERLAQAALQARQAVSATQEQVQAAEQRLLAAFGGNTAAVQDLQGQLEQAESATVTHVDGLQQARQRLQGEVDATLQHAHDTGLAPLHQEVTEHLAALHREHVSAPVDRLLQHTQHNLAEQLRQGVDAMLQQLSNAVRDIERQFSDSRQSSALQRGVLKPVLDELQQVWDPVKAASDAVHDLARSLGVR